MILSRVKFYPQERVDLEDLITLLSAARTDSKLWTKQFLSGENYILKGFSVSGLGLKSATIEMDNATLIMGNGTQDFSFFVSEDSPTDIVVADADLVDGVRNYVELKLAYQDGTPITKAFWDPSANGGLGAEFNQQVNTVTDLSCEAVVVQGGFTGNPDRVPLAIIDTDGSGNIKIILDRRPLFFRLGDPSDPFQDFTWASREEPVYSVNITSPLGSFIADETVTFSGGATATVVTGGTTDITIRLPSGVNFASGDTITGGSSGATGTVNTIIESFTGSDKDIDDVREALMAIMTEIKRVKGTNTWPEDPGTSIVGVTDLINAVMVQAVADTKFSWDGSNLFITNDALNPADSDVMAYLRQMSKNTDMALTRQDDGKEIQLVEFDIVPSSGQYTLEQNGDVSDPINWNDDASAVQAACNANWTNQVTVTGNTTDGFQFKFDVQGPQVELTEDSNTLMNGPSSVTLAISTIKNGLAGISAIPMSDGEVLFIKIPTLGSRTFSGVGTGDTNYQVVAIEDFSNEDGNYWLAYVENGLVYIRDLGELQTGEESPISDPDKETILSLISTEEAKTNQDRNAKLIEGGTWSLDLNGEDLTLSADAYVEIPGLSNARNTISAQVINLPNPTSVAYVKLNRDVGATSVRTVQVSDNADIILDSDVLVIARRVTDGVLVGTHSFLLQPSEFLTLDGALAELNRYFGQLKLKVHEADNDKVRINSADTNLLNGDILTKLEGTFVLDFSGAVIDFTTGEVFEEDGSTPLGVDFTPFSVPVGEYFWYGISVIPSSVGADNTIGGQIQVEPASTSDASQVSAPKPNISGDTPLGAIQVYNNAGNIEVVSIRRLGIGSGSGSGKTIKVAYLDPISTVLPSGTSVTVDGQSGVDDDLVLFTNLLTGNNRIYKLSGVGSSIVWTPQRSFSSQFDPADGDSVRVQAGDAFKDQLAVFNGTDFLVNDTVRFFDGVSANFWELGSIKSTSIADNTTANVFSVNVSGSENIVVEYSIVRGLAKETGQLFITSDGTNAAVTKTSAYLSDVGVEFAASISVGVLQLDYTSDNSGSTGTMKYFLKRWSDSPGGPSGVPSYSGGGSGGSAGGANTEVQFNNAGSLDGDSRFKWDASAGAIDLNGAKFGVLSSGITLNDNQVAPALAFQFAKSFSFVIVEYSISRDTDYRVGRLLIPNNGSTVSLNDDYVETGSTGITFSASVSGANINVNYTSTSTTFTGTLKYTIRKWS